MTLRASGNPSNVAGSNGSPKVDAPAVNTAQFMRDFEIMSGFGAIPGRGVDRQAASEADTAQRVWLADLLRAHGLTVEYDRIGNQFGILNLVPGAPFVLVGSHMDSQPTAGKYDGAYGVLAAAHAVFALADHWTHTQARPKYNLAVVNWFNEEGSRFAPSMMGSGVYTGRFDLSDALATTDRQGTSVEHALTQTDLIGTGDGPLAKCYAEIHIEQGRVLEDSKADLCVAIPRDRGHIDCGMMRKFQATPHSQVGGQPKLAN